MTQTRWTLSIVTTAALVAASGAAIAQQQEDCPFHPAGHEAAASAHRTDAGDAPHAVSPYVELQSREIAALGEDQTRQLLTGEGMGMALPAELHGFPGPKHVLDLAAEMELSTEQLRLVQASFDTMHGRAVELGQAIVDGERDLDRRFVERSIDVDGLNRRTLELARLRGELRAAHLAAHIDMARVLAPDQQRRYATLRGYDTGRSPSRDSDEPVE